MSFDTSEIPQSAGSYMKLKGGENRFRILASLVEGYVYWQEVDGKKSPVRKTAENPIDLREQVEKKIKFFWAFPVWNYAESAIQVMELTQKTIMREIQNLAKDEDWGDPKKYDIVVVKMGEDKETRYSVMPKPAKDLSEEATEAWNEIKEGFNLQNLFDNQSPFPQKAEDGKKKEPEQVDEDEEEKEEEINIDDIPF